MVAECLKRIAMKPEFLFSSKKNPGGFPQKYHDAFWGNPPEKNFEKNKNSDLIANHLWHSATISQKDFEKSFDDDPGKRV